MTKKFFSLLMLFLLLSLFAGCAVGTKSKIPTKDFAGNAVDFAAGEHILTQYADTSGQQASCYAIYGNDGLILIDGGWAENETALRDIIASYGNHVTAWILSHPHRDHIGAFNAICENPGDITIDAIYDNGFDYDFIESVGEPYDDITVMEKYHELTKDNPSIIHLHRDDSFSIGGLDVYVLNAYDEIVLYTVGDEKDYQNNASLLLLVKSAGSSMLFCSDIKYDMNDYLSETLSGALSCDYVQVGHHGNWSFDESFYTQTGASVFFFDAPASITDSADYPAHELKEHLVDSGKTVLDFSDAPNSVILR